MSEVLRLADPFYIVAEAERPEGARRVLKQGESFAVFDQHGDIVPTASGELGIYHDGTRFVSRLQLLLGTQPFLLLSSSVSENNAAITVDLTNPDVLREGVIVVARGEIHLFRSIVLWEGRCFQQIRISNYSLHRIEVPISIAFDADFVDLFEVRGTRRERRGLRLPGSTGVDSATLAYRGLDHVERLTQVRFDRPPMPLAEGLARFDLPLDPRASSTIEMEITCATGGRAPARSDHETALASSAQRLAERRARACSISSSNHGFDSWIRRSTADLEMMVTDTPHGLYPYAGVPWFSTPFGRDGIITAFELLWANPGVARGVLSYLASTQSHTSSDRQDAQPGKILHEARAGEMAALGEVPFGQYYGTIDATPLFVMLAAAYYRRTGDRELVDRLWPHLLAAIEWMERFGDLDGDGFIEYAPRSEKGLVQQGWKDSHDSVFHEDGRLAEPPIALCEVQGYAYAAWLGAAQLAAVRGDGATSEDWQARATNLRERFDEAFWCEDIRTYALALDGHKQPCRVRTSNPGHCLFTGIARTERARAIADQLMAEASFTGWGIRTVAAHESRYNPMSYHNGSVWPHDNALIAAGLARYRFMHEAQQIFTAMFGLSGLVDLHRLPELICGFRRRPEQYPTLYPVACAPQSWAAGAVYLLLQACLGLDIDARERRITFVHPLLPDWLESVWLRGLRVADASIDLLLERHPDDVGVTVLRRGSGVQIVTYK